MKMKKTENIHPTAIIDSSAEIDTDVSIGAYSIVGPDVKIGKKTTIGPHVVLSGPTTIGSGNRIFQFSSIGEIPQDKKFQGESSELIIGDNNTIREYVTINRGTEQDQGYTKIGDRNWIMAYVHIAHDCTVENDATFANGTTLAGHVTVEDYAILGGFTLVHQFCRVGAYSFCAMGTALNRDLPPYVMASGNYASTHGLNKEGLRRRGFSEECIAALHKSYKLLVRSKHSRDENLSEVKLLADQFPEVERFMNFVTDSERGIVQ
ncbi:MAG: acyl-ACP--UDP-N-acetylglucosamine O-acyltransferase [Gammaproteobacteria bacterium]